MNHEQSWIDISRVIPWLRGQWVYLVAQEAEEALVSILVGHSFTVLRMTGSVIVGR